MASEGESPILGCAFIAGAGFLLAISLISGGLAVARGSGLLWWGAGACLLWAAIFAWWGWREVCEATRFRRGMDAHRVVMLRAKNGL